MIKHFVKNMRIAKQELASNPLDLDVLLRIPGNYLKPLDEGHDDKGVQALIKAHDQEKSAKNEQL